MICGATFSSGTRVRGALRRWCSRWPQNVTGPRPAQPARCWMPSTCVSAMPGAVRAARSARCAGEGPTVADRRAAHRRAGMDAPVRQRAAGPGSGQRASGRAVRAVHSGAPRRPGRADGHAQRSHARRRHRYRRARCGLRRDLSRAARRWDRRPAPGPRTRLRRLDLPPRPAGAQRHRQGRPARADQGPSPANTASMG